MIEAPALVWHLDALLPMTDFVSVGGEQILHQVIGADRDEIRHRQQGVQVPDQGRRLDHHPHAQLAGRGPAAPFGPRHLVVHQGARRAEFLHAGDQGEHHAERAPLSGPDQGAQLQAQQGWPVQAQAHRAPAQGRVVLALGVQIGQHLVAAQVQGAEDHRHVAGAVDDL